MASKPYDLDTCTLPVVIKLVTSMIDRESPCSGCREDRARCGGEPNTEDDQRFVVGDTTRVVAG